MLTLLFGDEAQDAKLTRNGSLMQWLVIRMYPPYRLH